MSRQLDRRGYALVDVQNAPRHVLIVDSDPGTVADVTRALAGMDVEAVATPPAALERVVGSTFDALLLDPALGDDDDGALALLHRLRTVAPDTVVVIWSANPTVEFTVRAMRSGALDVLHEERGGRRDSLGRRSRDPARCARARGAAPARRGRARAWPRRGDRRSRR